MENRQMRRQNYRVGLIQMLFAQVSDLQHFSCVMRVCSSAPCLKITRCCDRGTAFRKHMCVQLVELYTDMVLIGKCCVCRYCPRQSRLMLPGGTSTLVACTSLVHASEITAHRPSGLFERVVYFGLARTAMSSMHVTRLSMQLQLLHGWAIALYSLGRHLDNGYRNSEFFYVLGRNCPSVSCCTAG